jgi:glycosyltransferase involved in cell wall biosynthesis
MLLRIWSRLLEDGVPQRARFKLVFVGRRGWNVDDVLASLDRSKDLYDNTVVHFEHLDDRALERLYAGCAFCLYPSQYEGFGVPIVEAFARGKAVIASNGGSLAEVVAGLSPALDPNDEQAWALTLRQWIEQPEARLPYEQNIRRKSPVRGWTDVAARMVAAAVDGSPQPREEASAMVRPAMQ